MVRTSRIAPAPRHLVQGARRQRRPAFQSLTQKGQEGVQHRSARARLDVDPVTPQRPFHRARMDPEMTCDRVLAPTLNRVEKSDLGPLPGRNHAVPLSSSDWSGDGGETRGESTTRSASRRRNTSDSFDDGATRKPTTGWTWRTRSCLRMGQPSQRRRAPGYPDASSSFSGAPNTPAGAAHGCVVRRRSADTARQPRASYRTNHKEIVEHPGV